MKVAPTLVTLLGLGLAAAQDPEPAVEEFGALPVPLTEGLFFAETFETGEDVFKGAWAKSSNSKYAGQPVSVGVQEDAPARLAEDKSLLLARANQHYGVAGAFPAPLDTTDKDFVVQYEVKLTEGLTCGGAYLKLLQQEADTDVHTFDNESPYVIMFGPDACGDTNKVHFILRHRNPVSGEFEEKHAQEVPAPKKDTKTHLYTLIIRTDNSYEILIDLERKAAGSLLTDMSPPVNPSKVIDDPTDFKPDDWVDKSHIPDPDATKPEDWDEDAPKKIPDAEAVQPADWLDEEPAFVPDPEAHQPADWDTDEDGEWEPPVIANPKCAKASGCGPWSRPLVDNPEYKGKWKPPMVDNPAYKGEWKPRQIDNPHYFEDAHPHNMVPMAAVAVEIWTTNGGIRMDNFVVETDPAAAKAFAEASFVLKRKQEDFHDSHLAKEQERLAREEKRAAGGIANLIEVGLLDLVDVAAGNPIPSVITVVVVLITLIFLCSPSGKKRTTPPTRTPAPAAASAGAAAEEVEVEEKEEKEKPKRKKTPKAS